MKFSLYMYTIRIWDMVKVSINTSKSIGYVIIVTIKGGLIIDQCVGGGEI